MAQNGSYILAACGGRSISRFTQCALNGLLPSPIKAHILNPFEDHAQKSLPHCTKKILFTFFIFILSFFEQKIKTKIPSVEVELLSIVFSTRYIYLERILYLLQSNIFRYVLWTTCKCQVHIAVCQTVGSAQNRILRQLNNWEQHFDNQF